MALFTRDSFKSTTQDRAGSQSFRNIVNEVKSKLSSAGPKTSIFMSHSHKDKDLIEEAVTFFNSINHSLYIDWLDDTMPEITSVVTAKAIRTKIILDDKFILLATNAAVESRWCNWELGIADAFKTDSDKLLILPLAENSGNWIGNEYLRIYPRIERVVNTPNFFYNSIFRIVCPDGTTKWLHEWLNST